MVFLASCPLNTACISYYFHCSLPSRSDPFRKTINAANPYSHSICGLCQLPAGLALSRNAFGQSPPPLPVKPIRFLKHGDVSRLGNVPPDHALRASCRGEVLQQNLMAFDLADTRCDGLLPTQCCSMLIARSGAMVFFHVLPTRRNTMLASAFVVRVQLDNLLPAKEANPVYIESPVT